MLCVALFLIFVVGVAISPWGKIKLGPDHSEPEYSFSSWFAMLFSAGYGIALLFFGVAEPILHYSTPPQGVALTVDAAKQAMQISYFHWGFHIWGIYGLTGLALAYFAFIASLWACSSGLVKNAITAIMIRKMRKINPDLFVFLPIIYFDSIIKLLLNKPLRCFIK